MLLGGLVSGCGDAPPEAGAPSPAAWGDCTIDAYDAAGGERVATLEGADARAPVRLVPPGQGPCAGGLVARTEAGVVGLDASGLDLEAGTARVVRLRGAGGDEPTELLLVNGGSHPRGGFQPHLFVLSDGLSEVTADGHPLLPFVATDGGGTPVTARCGDDGTVQVLTASTSKPPGVVLAWDVQRTTYRIDDGGAVRLSSEQIRDHAADPILRKELPQLFEPDGSFADCLRREG
jgi:hypothetical protein